MATPKHSKTANSGKLMSMFVDLVTKLMTGRKLKKLKTGLKNDATLRQSVDAMDKSYDDMMDKIKSYCEKYPDECEDVLKDPTL